MSRSSALPTLRPIRPVQRLAAALSVVALFLLPMLHGPHARHAGPGIDATPAAVASHAIDAPAPCPLCVFTAQARTAAPAAAVPALLARCATGAPLVALATESEPQAVPLDAAPPRAPPA